MLKKSLSILLILTFALVLFIPAALASGTGTKADPQVDGPVETNSASPSSGQDDYNNPQTGNEKHDIDSIPAGIESAEGLMPGSPKGTMQSLALSLPAITPAVDSPTLSWDSDGRFYYTVYAIIPDIAGFWGFKCISPVSEDTDVYLCNSSGDIIGDKNDQYSYDAFDTDYFLQADTVYYILIINWGSHANIKFIITPPAKLGTSACTIASNGYTNGWMQPFTVSTADQGLNTLYLTSPASNHMYEIWIYDSELHQLYNEENNSPEPRYLPKLKGDTTYYVKLNLINFESKNDTYTAVVEDGASSFTGMENDKPYSYSFSASDNITSNVLKPDVSSEYRFSCDRSDVKLTVCDYDGNLIAYEQNPITDIYLNKGTTYLIYYVTTDTLGEINYSVTRLLSEECKLYSMNPSFAVNPFAAIKTVEGDVSSVTVSPSVSDKAAWALYSDKECTNEIADKTMALSGGLNTSYLKITAEDGKHASVYPVYVFRKSADTDPVVKAFDSKLGEMENGAASRNYVDIALLGTFNATVNGVKFDWSTYGQEGVYNVVAADSNNRTGTFSFTIDKTAPTLPLTDEHGAPVLNDHVVNGAVTAGECVDQLSTTRTARKDNADYPWPADSVFREDGLYNITATDAVGNSRGYIFSIDTTPPLVSAVCRGAVLGNEDHTNGDVTVNVTDAHFLSKSVKRNGAAVEWPSKSVFTNEGVYVVTASDTVSNETVFTFTIDKTPPVITAEDSSNTAVKSNGVTGKSVTVIISGGIPKTAELGGTLVSWPSDNTFSAEGTYLIKAEDNVGNQSSFTFTIDKTAPAVKAVCGTKTLANGGHANGAVVVTVSDPHYKSKSVKKNGSSVSWPSGGKFTSAGIYDVIAADTLNNSITFRFTIDLTRPVITAKANGYSIRSGACTRYDVTAAVSDANFDHKTVTRDSADYVWPVSNKFTEDGKYEVKAYDKAGNITAFTFTIDKTPPVITAAGTGAVADKAYVNTNVTVSVSDINYSSKSVKKNGRSMKWPSGSTFTLSGSYVVTAKDKAGNAKTFSFVIDKVKPVISVRTTSGSAVYSGRATKYDVYVKASDSYLLTKTITRNGETIAWPSTNKFTQEGSYSVTAADRAGNTAAAYTFTINKPARIAVTETASGSVIANNGFADQSITIGYTEQFTVVLETIKKDGLPITWPGDDTVSEEGVYTISVKDELNTSVFTFTIDKTAPVITAKAYSGAAVGNGDPCRESRVTVYINEKNLASKTAARDGRNISWPSYSRFTSEGVYKVTAVDKAGNKTEFVFTIDRSKPVITCKTVASGSKITSGATVGDSVNITVSDRVKYSVSLTKDGAVMDLPENNTITENGVYTVTATDSLGYKNTFTFTVKKTS